jgi:hypothetical protein
MQEVYSIYGIHLLAATRGRGSAIIPNLVG